ncbi:MAG: N-6 DNA methylase [Bacteroidales bacterium]|jgi:type I restriction enzyme M protein|nr:N-6 DNA methylase [Bacteroidales bacterium]
MTPIELGIREKLISFDGERKIITYINQNKKRHFDNPEEKVQAETFLRLVFTYGYPVNRIRQFVTIQMGSEVKQADIIVYADDECESPFIVIECKKEEITDQEFERAVEQVYSYANSGNVHAKYVWVTSKIKDQYYEVIQEKPVSRIEIPDIPQYGVGKLASYKYVKGGVSNAENGVGEIEGHYKQKFFELETVNESELVKIFVQAHQALWGGGQRNPSEAFDELDKLIFCKIWDEKHPRKIGVPYDFQIFRDEDSADLLKRIKALYKEGQKRDPEVFKDEISLSSVEVQTIVKYLQRINLSNTDLDSKGKAFETFMGSYFRGDFGQYFTPRAIVKFIVDSLPIQRDSKVLDTSCGSGGFLLYALDKVRRQAKYFYDPIREEKNHFVYWHDFAEKNLFGIEINKQIARTAKMNMIIHDDGHTNVISSDGLVNDTELQKQNKGFQYGTFDFIITNPPFGSSIKLTEKAYLHQYNLGKKEEDWLAVKAMNAATRDSQSTEILFIEQCHRFLTEQGYLAIVIPDGILTNSSLQYVRDNIEEMFRIVAVVSMPQTAFTATGAGVKSSVLFLRKHEQKTSEKIYHQKLSLKDRIKKDNQYIATVEKWGKEKNDVIKKLESEAKKSNPTLSKKEITEIIKPQKSEIQAAFTEKINLFKDELIEKYLTNKKNVLNDYPIFMAIAEDIGYDATGKPTESNELDIIGTELTKFINAIEKGNV